MSLTSMLNGNSQQDKEFQEIFKKYLPLKEDFNTLYGSVPFSVDSDPSVPYNLKSQYDASVVGVAFEYYARFSIAYRVLNGKEGAYRGLKSERGLQILIKSINKKLSAKILERYEYSLTNYIESIYRGCTEEIFSSIPEKRLSLMEARCLGLFEKNVETNGLPKWESNWDGDKALNMMYKTIDICCFFARLELIARSNIIPNNLDILLQREGSEITHELLNLMSEFKEKFNILDIVSPTSKVIFSPDFGIYGQMICGGADADIYIDGILYDFKTGKNFGYNWREIAQLTGYFFLNDYAEIVYQMYEKDLSEDQLTKRSPPLLNCNILRLAFYRARLGEIQYVDTSMFTKDQRLEIVDELISFNVKFGNKTS